MPDDFDLDDLDLDAHDGEDESALVRRLRGVIKDKTRESKELKQQAEEGTAAKRKLALLDAKLPESPQVKFFLDHYDGDYTPEAIREAASQHGFIVVDQQTTDEINEVEAMMLASSGSPPAPSASSDKALMDKINAVRPGPNATKQIAEIMRQAGRMSNDE